MEPTFNPGPIMAQGADRRPVIAAAIHHMINTRWEHLVADFQHTDLKDFYKAAPHELLALLLTAAPDLDTDTRESFYSGSLTVLRSAGIPEPGHGGFDPTLSVWALNTAKHRENERAAVRARAAAGIRCVQCFTVYGALWVDHPAGRRFLCAGCIDTENTVHRGGRAVRPVEGGVPDGSRYVVRLSNATGRGGKALVCRTPQDAQFTAETERPYNNTSVMIWIVTP